MLYTYTFLSDSVSCHRVKHQCTRPIYFKCEPVSASFGGLVTTLTPEPAPRVSDSAGLMWGPGICISNKFPSDSDAAGLGTTGCEALT